MLLYTFHGKPSAFTKTLVKNNCKNFTLHAENIRQYCIKIWLQEKCAFTRTTYLMPSKTSKRSSRKIKTFLKP